MFGKRKFLLAFSRKCLEYEHFGKSFRENVYENENFHENVWNTDIFVTILDFRGNFRENEQFCEELNFSLLVKIQ